MKCREVNSLQSAYLDDEVTPSEWALVQAHLDQCAHCRHEMAALAQCDEHLGRFLKRQAAAVEPSPQAWKRLQARIEREGQFPLRRLFNRLRQGFHRPLEKRPSWANILAAFLLAALLIAFLLTPGVRTVLTRAARGLLAPFWQAAHNGPPSTMEPGAGQPARAEVNQPVRRYSTSAEGDVEVVLRLVEFYPDRIVVHWAMTNEGKRPARFPLNNSNILIQDNIGSEYPVGNALSDPQVLTVDPEQQVEGSCTVPGVAGPGATTLLISIVEEPFAGSPWSVTIPRRPSNVTPTPPEAYPQPERTPDAYPLPQERGVVRY